MHGIESLTLNLLVQSEGAEKLDIIGSLYVFMLAAFVGLEVIRKVSPLLHTPLMSLTNAISAISVVGSLVIAGTAGTPGVDGAPNQADWLSLILGTVAVCASMINIIGGYMITYRMVAMFKKREVKK